MDNEIWSNLLDEADKNKDGEISFEEFQIAMANMLKNNL
jgi:Ca2+-binding EF-hand superfamily protein